MSSYSKRRDSKKKTSSEREKTAKCHHCSQIGHFKKIVPPWGKNPNPHLIQSPTLENSPQGAMGETPTLANENEVKEFLAETKKFYDFYLYFNDIHEKERKIRCLVNLYMEGGRAERVQSIDDGHISDLMVRSLNDCKFDDL